MFLTPNKNKKYLEENDAIGQAIRDITIHNHPQDIIVESDIVNNDIIPIDYLFRSYDNFPLLEKKAMQLCKGKVLDIGSGAGPHVNYLLTKGFDVTTVEASPLASQYLASKYPDAQHFCSTIEEFQTGKYDTLLLLMNGIGIAGTLKNTALFLKKLKLLLHQGGQIICDSTDVKYLFTEEDGSYWKDLNSDYYGNFRFNMKYKEFESGWFDWVYIDKDNLKSIAEDVGLHFSLVQEEGDAFFATLKI